MRNFKDIHIGKLIYLAVKEGDIEKTRIVNFFKCTEKEIEEMYLKKSLDTELLLKWSKLLKYDFFRLYSQHLLLYSPPEQKIITNNSQLPNFRKNLYTKEIIDYILEKIDTGNLVIFPLLGTFKSIVFI
ncbi:transposase [Empedobacter falsenii]|uniref:Transposase n=1 Tax=Empedobacter falsenii TaxID=343874 RepID=A0AAW7DLI2_9FLAO|nr:transposase [Empedobacter falsenii]MDM1552908.1 transposase [Empedobacter falsenii]